jgi:transcriptional regulator with XRE-family HTH domain
MRAQIVRRRKAEGLSVYMLAKRAGISRSHLLAIESGQTDPSVGTLVKLAVALKVKPAELLE